MTPTGSVTLSPAQASLLLEGLEWRPRSGSGDLRRRDAAACGFCLAHAGTSATIPADPMIMPAAR